MSYFSRFTIILILFFTGKEAVAQYDNVWTFGKNGGLDFSNGSPQYLHTAIDARMNAASVCDAAGQLLFYTDGDYVWDKNNNLMQNGINLTNANLFPLLVGIWGAMFTSDATAIAMMPGSSSRYYIFSERREPVDPNQPGGFYFPAKLYYSVVDLALNNGMGAITDKGIYVDSNINNLTMIAGEDCNIWLLAHEGEGNRFKAYEITADGVAPPVVSQTGNTTIANGMGTLVVSPDRHRLAINYTFSPAVDVLDFDPATGIVSNATPLPVITTPPLFPPQYTCVPYLSYSPVFSPDSKKLYGTAAMGLGQADIRYIVQFDLTTTPYTATWLGHIMGSNNTATGMVHSGWRSNMKLGPDGKIYFHYIKSEPNGTPYPTRVDNDSCIGVINQPDITGVGCNVSLIPALYVPGVLNNVDSYFPNEIGMVLAADTIGAYQNICFRDSLRMIASDTTGFAYAWTDGSQDFYKTINLGGRYILSYYTHNPCIYHCDTFQVQKADFDFTLGPDTAICGDVAYKLKPFVPGASYLWPDQSTNNVFETDSTGNYWVAVTRNDCTLTDSVKLTFINLEQNLGKDSSLCEGDLIQISLKATVPAGATVFWNTGSTLDNIQIRDTGTYWIMVNQYPCTNKDTIRVSYDPQCYCRFTMPTAFSPNGDGANDIFLPAITSDCPIASFIFSIYNRWGQRVYSGTRPDVGWDGRYQGVPAEVGTYMYRIDFLGGTRNKKYSQKGDITLIR